MKKTKLKPDDETKRIWMDGARAGMQIAFDLVFTTLESLMKNMDIKRRVKSGRIIRSK